MADANGWTLNAGCWTKTWPDGMTAVVDEEDAVLYHLWKDGSSVVNGWNVDDVEKAKAMCEEEHDAYVEKWKQIIHTLEGSR